LRYELGTNWGRGDVCKKRARIEVKEALEPRGKKKTMALGDGSISVQLKKLLSVEGRGARNGFQVEGPGGTKKLCRLFHRGRKQTWKQRGGGKRAGLFFQGGEGGCMNSTEGRVGGSKGGETRQGGSRLEGTGETHKGAEMEGSPKLCKGKGLWTSLIQT